MDAISYSLAAKQAQRIEKFIENPDSTSGIVTVPKIIASGETITIPEGRVAVLPNVQVDGTLNIEGEVFIPSGASVSTTEIDATIVKQNGNVVANNSAVVHKTGNETIAGVKTFSSSPLLPVPTLVNQAISMGNILEKTGLGIGYGTGAGGTVTQLTSKSTAVTLNKPCGQITMHNASLAAGASVTFQLVNSIISVYDTLVCNLLGIAYLSAYSITCIGTENGYAYFSLKNNTGSSLSDAVQVGFSVVKGTIA